MSMTEAERRREARRQRILNNQESRINKILGTTGTTSSSSSSVPPSTTASSSLFEEDVSISRTRSIFEDSHNDLQNDQETPVEAAPVTNASSLQSSVDKSDVDVGIVSIGKATSKISQKQHLSFVCAISLLLSLWGGKYFLIYLLSYELTFFFLNGMSLPAFYTSENILLSLMTLFGTPEWRRRIGLAALLFNWIVTDLTVFIAAAVVPVFILGLLNHT